MTKLQFDSLYYGRAVHCDTEEKAKEFLTLAESVGYKWFGGATTTAWELYKQDTHYLIRYTRYEADIVFGTGDYFLTYNFDCVEFIPQSQKLKIGDRVRVNNTVFTDINERVGVIQRVHTSSPVFYIVKIEGNHGHEFWYLYEAQLEKVEESPQKVETTETLIDEIKAKCSEINILLNRLEIIEKEE